MSPVDRRAPPVAGEERAFSFPPFERLAISPAGSMVAARWGAAPLVSFELLHQGGGSASGAVTGLSSLAGALLDEGTARRSGGEVARRVEGLGASLQCGADWDCGWVSASGLSSHANALLELVAEITLEASFPEREVERQRRLRLAEIARRRVRAGTLADELLAHILFSGHPYARPLRGTASSIEGISRDQLVGFHRQAIVGSELTLVAVGDFDLDTVAQRLRALLATHGAQLIEEPPCATPPPLAGLEVHLIDRPQAPQTELRIGQLGIDRHDPDRLPLLVLNSLLGGKFSSRLNLELREELGVTYGVRSSFQLRRQRGAFTVAAAVDTEAIGISVRRTLAQLERLRQEPVGKEELHDTISYLRGVFPYTLQTVHDLAGRLTDLVVHRLADDHYDRQRAELSLVSGDEVQRVARRHLRPDQVAVVVVGPAAELMPQLAELAPLHLWRTTGNGFGRAEAATSGDDAAGRWATTA